MTNEDRIRLAEAIFGPDKVDTTHFPELRVWIDGKGWRPFDPEHDANDDYAVLEWMREQDNWQDFWGQKLMIQMSNHYQIGNFARAALKVIDDE